MSFFIHEEPKKYSKTCRVFRSWLSDALVQCGGRRSSSLDSDDECSLSDTDEEEMIIMTIRARAMEAKRRKGQFIKSESFSSSPWAGELFIISAGAQRNLDSFCEQGDEERDVFLSVGSCLSRCSSSSREAFFSAGSCLSRSSSVSKIELWDVKKRSMLQELCHCEGWPFGLYRKAILLPPLPKSPSESWLWRKGSKMVKTKDTMRTS
ncbi:hypothetical protein FRX31_020206 [Thalictrum thalictroides]|uniref:Uncharacterized protein n=1 Tax=Thalictrum thalictroides TaxID=46969 RepID=A0A7J6VZS6_THATH|nr:hypothetical protein FRX31_020206 [Thalictrum thalictroides]